MDVEFHEFSRIETSVFLLDDADAMPGVLYGDGANTTPLAECECVFTAVTTWKKEAVKVTYVRYPVRDIGSLIHCIYQSDS